MSNEQTRFFDNLVTAAKENPLAALLIGAGTFYLFTGNQKFKNAASTAKAAAPIDLQPPGSRSSLSASKRSATPPEEEGSFRVGETLRDLGGTASGAISGTADMNQRSTARGC